MFFISSPSLRKLEAFAKTTRKNTECEYDGIKSMECDILRAEDFEEKFGKAFPDILLAAGGSSLYGISRKSYLEEYQYRRTALIPNRLLPRTKLFLFAKMSKL